MSLTNRPAISVILPTYNRASLLREALLAYERQDLFETPFEVIVIDDGSSDDTAELLRSLRPSRYPLRTLTQPNSGPAVARNRGIEAARGELLLFVGDDIIPHSGMLREHYRRHREAAQPHRTAILGHVSWHPRHPLTTVMATICGPGGEQFSYSCFRDGQVLDFRHFYTCNISLPRRLLDNRRFLTCFPHAAFEDTELGHRLATQAGMQIVYAAGASGFHVHHYTARSFGRRQCTCGRMAAVLCRVRPQAAWATRRGYFLGLALSSALLSRLRSAVDAPATVLEEDLLSLAERYDEVSACHLRRLHHTLFAYQYFKGYALAEFSLEEASPFFTALLFLTTADALRAFLDANNPSLPADQLHRLRRLTHAYPGWSKALIARLQRLGSRLLR